MMRRNLVVLMTLLSFFVSPRSFATVSENHGDGIPKFLKAGEALEQQNFEAAITQYQELIDEGFESAQVHYNLGIAFFRSGKVGQAIFHFRVAKTLDPNDADIRFNLEYARKKTKDKLVYEPTVIESLLENHPLNEKQSLYTLAVFVVLLTFLSVVQLFSPIVMILWARRFVFGACLFFCAAYGLSLTNRQNFGVVSVEKAQVLSGKSVNHVHLFSLHEGTEFVIESGDESWVKILLKDGKKGWISRSSVTID